MSAFPRDLIHRRDGRNVRLPDQATIVRIPIVAHELARIAGELAAIGIDAPTIEARFVALSIKHRRTLDYIDAGIVSALGRHHLRYLQHYCPDLVIGYAAGVFAIRPKGAADEAVA